MKITNRLILISSISISFILTIGVLSLLNFRLLSNQIEKNISADLLAKEVFELNVITYQYVMYGQERMKKQWQQKFESFGKLIDRILTKDFSRESRAILNGIKRSYDSLESLFYKIQRNLSERNRLLLEKAPEIEIKRNTLLEQKLITRVLMRTHDISISAFEISRITQNKITAIKERNNLFLSSIILGFIILVAFISFFSIRRISTSINKLLKGAEIVGAGNLTHKFDLTGNDELAQFSRAFDTMVEKLNLLMISRDEMQKEIEQRKLTEASLTQLRADLENIVNDRTKELRFANTELSQYAYVVSHDLKAPLRAIRNYSDFLREDLEEALDGDQKEYLDGLNRAVGQGEELVNDLLSLARIEKSDDEYALIDIKALILELAESLNLGENVELSISEDLPKIVSDRILLVQIFRNLLDNAVKFNKSPVKRILISRNEHGDNNFEILVQDNGIGIEPRFFDKIFQVFQQLHTRQEYNGTGMGLAIVKKAAAKLGGSVRVASEPGKGSTFSVNIPSSKQE